MHLNTSSKVKTPKNLVVDKKDRLALYSSLSADDTTIRNMNTQYAFPLQVYGQDGKTYVLDQFAD